MQRHLLMIWLGLAAGLTASPGSAQVTPSPAPPPPVMRDTDPNKPLSEKLQESEGVLIPNPNIDPQMQIVPPTTSPMPVIPPPGEPGGDQSIQPK